MSLCQRQLPTFKIFSGFDKNRSKKKIKEKTENQRKKNQKNIYKCTEYTVFTKSFNLSRSLKLCFQNLAFTGKVQNHLPMSALLNMTKTKCKSKSLLTIQLT